jgi:hypothetical protein
MVFYLAYIIRVARKPSQAEYDFQVLKCSLGTRGGQMVEAFKAACNLSTLS